MEARVAAILAGTTPEQVWLVEHPPLYTGGTSAKAEDLLDPDRFPVFATGRGGEYTYHGPGQRVAYVMLDLNRRGRDLRRFVATLEDWVIDAVGDLGVTAGRRKNCVGIWVDRADKGAGKQDKIAAIGVRVRRWVTFHGIALNVDPVLEHFSGIVPCGVTTQGVTSLADLGRPATMADADRALRRAFETHFGKTISG
jgi:lipoyl(octanoyl) transferase